MARPDDKTEGGPVPAALRELPDAAGEEVWIDVIRKMDEVYSDLLQYEVELERKNAALEESQRFVYSVLTAMSDILVVCDRDGRIQQVNQALRQLTGGSDADFLGHGFDELFADESSCARARQLMRVAPAGTLQEYEAQLRTPAGGLPVAMSCTPRVAPDGKFLGLVVTGRPVGELRRAYEALRQAHEDLKRTQQQLVQSEKMASLGRLVAGVAHELNNPISFVLGNAYALQRYSRRIGEYLAAVHAGMAPEALTELRQRLRIDRLLEDLAPLIDGTIEGAERTRDIVAGLRRFSAPDRAGDVVFNLAEVLERSLHWVVRAAGARVRLDVQLPRELPVKGSPGQMQQVLVNLVQNALDSLEHQAEPRLEARGGIEERRVLLHVLDNGPGFAPEALTRVFDPFYTTKPPGKGTGLGLSISYGIVARHGGELRASNRPGGGACMTLSLPLAGGYEDSAKSS